jgi:hypothetical protein
MKPNRSVNYIRIALSCLVLILALIWLVLPVLAIGIVQISGNPIQPEKLDIRPIPVPVPPEPLVGNEPPISATPSASLASGSVPQPIPVPTPPVSATQTAPLLAERQMPEASATVTVQIANPQEIIAMALMFVVLLIWLWLHRTPSLYALNRKNA